MKIISIALLIMGTLSQMPINNVQIPGMLNGIKLPNIPGFPNGIPSGLQVPIANAVAASLPVSIATNGNCLNRNVLTTGNLDMSDYQHGAPAMGFQYDSGAMWSVICLNTPYGSVPGKMNLNGQAWFAWGGKEHNCSNKQVMYGELISNKDDIPCNCKPKAHQTNDNMNYYNALIPSKHGMVPGKARADRLWAWYGWGLREHAVQDNFYIVC